MSKGNINISVSGGSNEFGNIVQGDGNQISSSTTKALQDFHSEISDLQEKHGASIEQVEALRKEVDLLVKNGESEDLMGKAKSLYEKYSWAIEPLKKLFQVIIL